VNRPGFSGGTDPGAVQERGLAAELTGHVGYEVGDPAGRGSSNSRNGHTPKTVQSHIGPAGLVIPRDRNSTFSPQLIPKGERRLGGLDDMIISLYAGGTTVRDIGHHLPRTVGTELSPETISKVTDAVLEEVKAWQSRPLEAGQVLTVVANPGRKDSSCHVGHGIGHPKSRNAGSSS